MTHIDPTSPARREHVREGVAAGSAVTGEPASPIDSVAVLGRSAPVDSKARVSARYIWLIVLAEFGTFLALVTPVAISLSIRVEQLVPDNTEVLGYILGVGSLAVVILGPFIGVASDRTRSRFGRRRPWIVATMFLGLVAMVVLAVAPNAWILALGWILAQCGFGSTGVQLINSLADRLPESQRGRVSGLFGLAQMLAPVFGAMMGGALAGQPFALFLVPAVIGSIFVLLFVIFIPEADTRGVNHGERLTAGALLRKFIFNPARYPDFSWNWLGRFVFFFGLTFNTTFTAFFFASKLGVPVAEAGGLVAIAGLLGLVGTMGGALLGGFLSDKLRRRRAFVLGSGVVFAAGTLTMALSADLVLLLVGSFLCNIALGVFSAVDQALVLDVLPERDTDAGRFNAINQFSISIPQALAPLVAPLIVVIGAGAGEQNYALLYLIAGALTVIGGIVVLRVKSVR